MAADKGRGRRRRAKHAPAEQRGGGPGDARAPEDRDGGHR